MFRWLPWLFDFQYMLFMYFAPTRWLARRAADRPRASRADAADPGPRPGSDRLHLPGRHRRSRRAAPQGQAERALLFVDHRSGRAAVLGPPGDRPALRDPPRVDRRGRDRSPVPGASRWAKPPTSPAFLAARSRADARRSLGLPADGKVIAVSGGGWGVGDLLGATRAALEVPDATVLMPLRAQRRSAARVAQQFPDEPRLRLMGFTDRMGDVLAASDALIHSSAGLTVLEAIIRGCPVISYGFGVRPRPGLQPRARALRARPGRPQGGRPRPGAAAGARAPARPGPLVRSAALDGVADHQQRAASPHAGDLAGTHRARTATTAAVLVSYSPGRSPPAPPTTSPRTSSTCGP